MDFKNYYLKLSTTERDLFVEKASTSRGYCNQIAYANKQIELGMADVFVALSGGNLTLDELPLTDRAKQQLKVRSSDIDDTTPNRRDPDQPRERRNPDVPDRRVSARSMAERQALADAGKAA